MFAAWLMRGSHEQVDLETLRRLVGEVRVVDLRRQDVVDHDLLVADPIGVVQLLLLDLGLVLPEGHSIDASDRQQADATSARWAAAYRSRGRSC